jgi:hypothetical protein
MLHPSTHSLVLVKLTGTAQKPEWFGAALKSTGVGSTAILAFDGCSASLPAGVDSIYLFYLPENGPSPTTDGLSACDRLEVQEEMIS